MRDASKTEGGTAIAVTAGKVLVVAGERPFAEGFLAELGKGSKRLLTASLAAEALELARQEDPDVLLVPYRLVDMGGMDFLRQLQTAGLEGRAVMLLPEDGLEHGAEALRLGARDVVLQPACADQVLAALSLVSHSRELERENQRLRQKLGDLRSGEALVGCSPAIRRLAGVLARVAESSATVLIEGQPGVGKTLAAQIIHASSRRSEKPCLSMDSVALDEGLIAQMLEEAKGGSLLLEDIDQLPAAAQARLVRYLKERSSKNSADAQGARIMATTSAYLPELVARGRFREDLYYRLNVFPVVVPSLRERRDDVTLLATHFLEQTTTQDSGQQQSCGFTTAALILLETHPWPGNAAQLQSAIFRAHAMAKDAPIDRGHLLGPTTGLTMEVAPEDASRGRVAEEEDEEVREEHILPMEVEEKRLLARALKATGGNVRRAAQLLRIGRATLYRKIQAYKLKLN